MTSILNKWLLCGLCPCLMMSVATVALGLSDDDKASQLAAGRAVLEKLAPIPSGATRAYHYEMLLGPKQTVGYATISLKADGHGDSLRYHYTNETAVWFPTGDKIISSLSAELRPSFEPIDMTLKKTHITPDGAETAPVNGATIGKDKVKLFAGTGEQRETREVARPDGPIVFAIECLADRIDRKHEGRFLLREFDLQSGGARDLTLWFDLWQDGTPTLVTMTADETASYQFWYDDAGRLIRWAEASMPILFVRVTAARIEQLKPNARATAPSDKPTPPAAKPTAKPDKKPTSTRPNNP